MDPLFTQQKQHVFSVILKKFIEGGPFLMSLILICFLLSLVFLVKGFMNFQKNTSYSKKMISLAEDASLLALVIGVFGTLLGLISELDSYEGANSSTPQVLAIGLKMSFLTTLFGSLVFISIRAGMLILRSLLKTNDE